MWYCFTLSYFVLLYVLLVLNSITMHHISYTDHMFCMSNMNLQSNHEPQLSDNCSAVKSTILPSEL